MIIALKHDNSTLIGIYGDLLDFYYSDFKFEITPHREIKTTSKHFEGYMIKEIVSTISYSKEYKKEEMIKYYIGNYFKNDIKRYGIKIFKSEEL